MTKPTYTKKQLEPEQLILYGSVSVYITMIKGQIYKVSVDDEALDIDKLKLDEGTGGARYHDLNQARLEHAKALLHACDDWPAWEFGS